MGLRRRAALRRRGQRLLVAVRRSAFGKVARVRCELDIPLRRLTEVATAISGLVGESAALVGRAVGCVGIVPGEEPVLVALAPRRDVVAARVRAALESGETHRHPELWLTLPPGAYLGKVVDPYVPFEGGEGAILELLGERGVSHALLAELVTGPASAKVVLTLYAPRPDARKLFTLARSALADLPGWAAMR